MFEARHILLSALEGFESETDFAAVVEAQSLLVELDKAAFESATQRSMTAPFIDSSHIR
jgi:hypothetical protein